MKTVLNNKNIKWLLDSEPWIEHIVRIELLGQSEKETEVKSCRKKIFENIFIKNIIDDLMNWPCLVISSHKSAKQPFHKISFLAEIGFNKSDPFIKVIISKMIEHISPEGIIKLPLPLGTSHRKEGTDSWGWALCDAPINIYSVAKLGFQNDKRIKKGVETLSGLVKNNGWPCAVSKELGNWRGPGKKDDPCPYATLVMLKLLSLYDEYNSSKYVRYGIDCLCKLWSESRNYHPYIFYMGNDFRKLKAPFIWYDILHVLEVLSRFEYAKQKPEFIEMLNTVIVKKDINGRFSAQSVWMEFKEWDFGQKKIPSKYITFLIYRIIKRTNYNFS